MGSPMVFQTAPPQPASKARMTCSPQFVGGPEASQKGLGHRMPANFVVRSAILSDSVNDCQGGPSAVGYRIDHFAATVDAVAAGIVFRVRGPAGGTVDHDRTEVHLNATRLDQFAHQAALAEGGDHHIAFDGVFRAWD